MFGYKIKMGVAGKQARNIAVMLVTALTGISTAQASNFEFWGISAKYTLVGNYGASWRLEEPSNRIIATGGRKSVPISEELKYPESNNFDDGNRNFDQYDMVNNRTSLLGDIEFRWRDYGLLIRGDAFYDDVYANNHTNAHTAPDRINTTQEPFNTFTDAADEFSGARARITDAYLYGDFYFGDTMAMQLRLGKHIAAWGQSLFFNGLALSQATADATKAALPGAEVKSILLPINQASMRFTLNEKITLLAQYQFDFEPFELNPVGEFYSVADVVGPGTEFAYGIKNPFFPDTLSQFDISDPNDLAAVVMTINQAMDGQLNSEQLEAYLASLPIGLLPSVFLPETGMNPYDASEGLNPTFAGFIEPDKKDKQYGVGIEYALTDITTLGAYYLRYHQKTPAVVLNYGSLELIPEQEVAPGVIIPALSTGDLQLIVPETFNIKFFDNVDLYAVGFSTLLFGWNVGGEYIHRKGIDVMVDVDNGVNGLVPTPTRANSDQILLNAIYTYRPPWFFDTIIAVAEIGWIKASDVEPQQSVEGEDAGSFYDELTFDEEASAIATLFYLDKRNVFAGWDMRIPIAFQRSIRGRAPLAGAFGSLFSERDTRIGIGAEFTRLQKLTLGVNYSGFTGGAPHFLDRPMADRDTISVNAKYTFY